MMNSTGFISHSPTDSFNQQGKLTFFPCVPAEQEFRFASLSLSLWWGDTQWGGGGSGEGLRCGDHGNHDNAVTLTTAIQKESRRQRCSVSLCSIPSGCKSLKTSLWLLQSVLNLYYISLHSGLFDFVFECHEPSVKGFSVIWRPEFHMIICPIKFHCRKKCSLKLPIWCRVFLPNTILSIYQMYMSCYQRFLEWLSKKQDRYYVMNDKTIYGKLVL